jgi:hypothetical protein
MDAIGICNLAFLLAIGIAGFVGSILLGRPFEATATSRIVSNYFRNDIYSKLRSQHNLRPTRREKRPKGAFDQPLTLRLIRTFIPPYKVSVIVVINFDEVAKRIFAIVQPIVVRARIYPPNL